MKTFLLNFIDAMQKRKWNITLEQSNELPYVILDRYSFIPKDYMDFLYNIKSCSNESNTAFILCNDDFTHQDENRFFYNEFEKISYNAAIGDEEMQKKIKEFWDRHLPICISLKSGYSYYAINLDDLSVVKGEEVEFEETELIAPSFYEFLKILSKGELDLD